MGSLLDNIIAEADSYTSYCKLVDYQVAKAKEYVDKVLNADENVISLVTAAFPYGVGPAIIAARSQAKQATSIIEDQAEQVAAADAIQENLDELTPPEDGC